MTQPRTPAAILNEVADIIRQMQADETDLATTIRGMIADFQEAQAARRRAILDTLAEATRAAPPAPTPWPPPAPTPWPRPARRPASFFYPDPSSTDATRAVTTLINNPAEMPGQKNGRAE